jgi:hypothetical protein
MGLRRPCIGPELFGTWRNCIRADDQPFAGIAPSLGYMTRIVTLASSVGGTVRPRMRADSAL